MPFCAMLLFALLSPGLAAAPDEVHYRLESAQHMAPVLDAALSPTGEEIYTVSLDGTLRVWAAESLQLLRTVEFPLELTAGDDLRVAGNGSTLALAVVLDQGPYLWTVYCGGSVCAEPVGDWIAPETSINMQGIRGLWPGERYTTPRWTVVLDRGSSEWTATQVAVTSRGRLKSKVLRGGLGLATADVAGRLAWSERADVGALEPVETGGQGIRGESQFGAKSRPLVIQVSDREGAQVYESMLRSTTDRYAQQVLTAIRYNSALIPPLQTRLRQHPGVLITVADAGIQVEGWIDSHNPRWTRALPLDELSKECSLIARIADITRGSESDSIDLWFQTRDLKLCKAPVYPQVGPARVVATLPGPGWVFPWTSDGFTFVSASGLVSRHVTSGGAMVTVSADDLEHTAIGWEPLISASWANRLWDDDWAHSWASGQNQRQAVALQAPLDGTEIAIGNATLHVTESGVKLTGSNTISYNPFSPRFPSTKVAPDGSFQIELAPSNRDARRTIRATRDGDLLWSRTFEADIRAMAISGDGQRVIVHTASGRTTWVSAKNNELLFVLQAWNDGRWLAWDNAGRYLVSAGAENQVRRITQRGLGKSPTVQYRTEIEQTWMAQSLLASALGIVPAAKPAASVVKSPSAAVAPQEIQLELHLLAVGVSRDGLKAAHTDAMRFAEAFAEQEGRLFTSVNTEVLTAEPGVTNTATADMVVVWLANMLKRKDLGTDDLVIVYLAGHGTMDSLTSEYRYYASNSKSDLPTSFLTGNQLRSYLKALSYSTKVLLVLDTCSAASAGNTPRSLLDRGLDAQVENPGPPSATPTRNVKADFVNAGSGLAILAASAHLGTAGEYADGGVFTNAIIASLKSVGSQPEVITLSGLFNAAANRTNEATNGLQVPQHMTWDRSVANFPIAAP